MGKEIKLFWVFGVSKLAIMEFGERGQGMGLALLRGHEVFDKDTAGGETVRDE